MKLPPDSSHKSCKFRKVRYENAVYQDLAAKTPQPFRRLSPRPSTMKTGPSSVSSFRLSSKKL